MATFYWSNKTPAAPAASRNVTFQSDGGTPEKRSAYVGPAAADTPGVIKLDPALSASKYLGGDGNWNNYHGIPAAGIAGQVLTKASNSDHDVAWSTPASGGDPIQIYSDFDDFVEQIPSYSTTGGGKLGVYAAGSGSLLYQAISRRIGVYILRKAGASGSQVTMASLQPYITVGSGEITFETEVAISRPVDVQSLDNGFICRVGFGDTQSGRPDNRICIQLEKSDAGVNKWRGACVNAGTGSFTAIANGYMPEANEWVRLKIVINAAGNAVEFFVNGSSVGTLTTNIPTITLREFFQLWVLSGSTNLLQTDLSIDWRIIQIAASR